MSHRALDQAKSRLEFRAATPTADPVIARQFYQLWRDNGVAASGIVLDWQDRVEQFIAQARRELEFQAFVAEAEGQIVGSVSCQRFAGLYPLILTSTQRDYGYVWGVYVEPAYRRRGIGSKLTQLACDYLKSIGCTHAILHASPTGQPVYAQLGFALANEMRLDLRLEP